jgi:thiol-disulfide isomerase/thioredoxin
VSAEGEGRLDAIGVLAHVVYVLVGGFLVLGFAWAIVPAVEAQNDAACRSLSPEERRQEAPDVSFEDLDGNDVRLSDLRGRFLVVNFWASWCEPCITEWPQLEQLAQRLDGRQDVEVVAVSVDEQLSDVKSFLDRMSLANGGVRVLHDPTGEVPGAFGTTKLPDTYFVDESGQVIHAYVNVRQWGSPAAFRCVDSIVGRAR